MVPKGGTACSQGVASMITGGRLVRFLSERTLERTAPALRPAPNNCLFVGLSHSKRPIGVLRVFRIIRQPSSSASRRPARPLQTRLCHFVVERCGFSSAARISFFRVLSFLRPTTPPTAKMKGTAWRTRELCKRAPFHVASGSCRKARMSACAEKMAGQPCGKKKRHQRTSGETHTAHPQQTISSQTQRTGRNY